MAAQHRVSRLIRWYGYQPMARRREGRAGGVEADHLNPRRCLHGPRLTRGANHTPTGARGGLGNGAPGIAQPGDNQLTVLLHGFSATRHHKTVICCGRMLPWRVS